MAVPFRKVSKTRRDMRRTHYKVTANGLVKCSNCGEMIRPHRACPKCGFYKGENKNIIFDKYTKEICLIDKAELDIDITMQELQAINKKVEELKWMD